MAKRKLTKTKTKTKAKPNKKIPQRADSKFVLHRDQAHPVLQLLKEHYPDAHCALKHKNSFELLVATILSAQCTDERVNAVTPALFEKYPDARSLAQAKNSDVEFYIRSINFFKNKAKNLVSCAKSLMERFQGEVPQDLESLTSLAGVGRKTANVVLGNSFQIATGVVVDTHVARLSQRLGWSQAEDPIRIESDLMELFPESEWINLAHYLIYHGRQICKARSPACDQCFLFDLCPKNKV